MHPLLLVAFLSLVGLTVSLASDSFVTAQTPDQTLEVSPPTQDLSADPGETVTAVATLRNQSNEALPIVVDIEDFTASGEEGQVSLTTESEWAVSSWTDVSPNSFTLEPGEEQQVTATISVPQDAAGGRYGSFVFRVQTDEEAENAASVSQQIASLFLLRISGPVDESLTLTDISAPKFSEFGPIPVSMRFENDGNVYVKVYGIVNVTDMFGNKVADIVVPSTNVFPDAARVVRANLDKVFLFGPYTATAIMTFGDSNETLTQTTTFYAFPLRIAAVILLGLFILIFLRKRIAKAFRAFTK